MKTILPNKDDDFSAWYNAVIEKAELAEHGPVRGTMIIRPWGFAIWERLQQELDQRIKATGAQNAYFPLFIPESFIKKETAHLKGFAPQLAVVTTAGGEKLAEPLVVRPTSETIVNHAFAHWIKSYRDLPMAINQWCNVVRWELRPRLFIRSSEFLWQEGHTAHATESEANERALQMLDLYREFLQNIMALPILLGKKSETERFAGAEVTYTLEAMMGDGKALQAGTSHHLGQHFAEAFDISFQDERGQVQRPHQTSWGVSTRLLGALVGVHGDDRGLALPPAVAPYQIVILPIAKLESDNEAKLAADKIAEELRHANLRAHVDDRAHLSFGWRSTEWELKGVPVRLELGPKDLRVKKAVLVKRTNEKKEQVSLSGIVPAVQAALGEVERTIFTRAEKSLSDHTHDAATWEELKKHAATGFARAPWCGDQTCETKLKELQASIRLLPFEQPKKLEKCAICGKKPGKFLTIIAKAY